MCNRFIFALLLLPCLVSLEGFAPRAHSWKPEALPGSARLPLVNIQKLVLPPAASESLIAAAADLQAVWLERVGEPLKILRCHVAPLQVEPQNAIILQRSTAQPFAEWRGQQVAGSFTLARQRNRIYLGAQTDAGLLNAVYALCTDVLGARWYWPSDIGQEFAGEVPRFFPEERWLEAPAFVQRRLHPMINDFGRRNRLVGGYQFNHALSKIFTPELFAVNQELFSKVYGTRRKPTGSAKQDPQPDFTNPQVVEVAAKAALQHFQDNPESQSFSLSINDNCLFDDSERTAAALGPLHYFRERPNYTDLVFGFMNNVAKRVEELHELQVEQNLVAASVWQTPNGGTRYLTALAYYWTEQSPSITVHPNVMPVLTSDRAQWHDPEYRAEDRALIERWSKSGASRIATWDYYFGAPLPYPRQFNSWIAESLKHLADNQITVFFSQLPSAWGLDGAKAWLAAQLLWNPWQNSAALLDEYYTQFFGAAADSMRAFYEGAEAHREMHAGSWQWIKYYKDEAGIALFTTEVLTELRALIERAKEEVAEDARRLARVQIVSDAFTFTELQAAYQTQREELLEASFAGAVTGGEISAFIQARAAFESYGQLLIKEPLHARLKYFTGLLQSDPVPIAIAALAAAGQPIEFSGAANYSSQIDAARKWMEEPQSFKSLLPNADLKYLSPASQSRSFLPPKLPRIANWSMDFRPSEHLHFSPASHSGTAPSGLRASGADVFSIFTNVAVEGARDYLLDCHLAYKVSPDNRTQLSVRWMDAEGQRIGYDYPLQLPVGQSAGLQRIQIPFHSPQGAQEARLHFRVSRQYEGDYLELQKIDFGLLERKLY